MKLEVEDAEGLLEFVESSINSGFRYANINFDEGKFNPGRVLLFKQYSEAQDNIWTKNALGENWAVVHLKGFQKYLDNGINEENFLTKFDYPLFLDSDNMKSLTAYGNNSDNVDDIVTQLVELGLPETLKGHQFKFEIDFFHAGDKIDFVHHLDVDGEFLHLRFHFERDKENDQVLQSFTALLVDLKRIAIADITINDVSLKFLDGRMKTIDWKNLEGDTELQWFEQNTELYSIYDDMEKIKKCLDVWQPEVGTLLFKHFVGTPLEFEIPFMDKVASSLGVKQKFPVSPSIQFNIEEAVKILKGASIYKVPYGKDEEQGAWFYNSDKGLKKMAPFDLTRVLQNLDLQSMKNKYEIERTIGSLKKGNQVLAWFDKAPHVNIILSVNGRKGGLYADFGWIKCLFGMERENIMKLRIEREDKAVLKGTLKEDVNLKDQASAIVHKGKGKN